MELQYQALWRAAFFHSVLGLLSEEWRGHLPWYQQGEAYAHRAQEVRPNGIEARYWLIALQGRRAILGVGAGEASELALSVREGAHWILDQNSRHPGAHHALGRLYFEVLTLPTLHRLIGRLLVGRSLIGEANWEDAEHFLRRASTLEPESILYRVDLARLLIERDRIPEARRELGRALATPLRYPPDRSYRAEAQKLLSGIR